MAHHHQDSDIDRDGAREQLPLQGSAPSRMGRWTRRFAAPLVVSAVIMAAVGCSSSDGDGDSDGGDRSPSTTTAETAERGSDVDADVVLSTEGEVIATVDDRFQSYNVEMVEVTGGEFWQPYDAGSGRVKRPPLDLSDERIRNLADALGPSYIRVSGSWANQTFFDPDGDPNDSPPPGFGGLLTGDQ